MRDFAAIDFETANNERTSVCSVGVVIVRDGEIMDTFYSLYRFRILWLSPCQPPSRPRRCRTLRLDCKGDFIINKKCLNKNSHYTPKTIAGSILSLTPQHLTFLC